jgi:hypothetical protein
MAAEARAHPLLSFDSAARARAFGPRDDISPTSHGEGAWPAEYFLNLRPEAQAAGTAGGGERGQPGSRVLPAATEIPMMNTNVLSRCLWTLLTLAMVTRAWSEDPAKPVVTGQFQKAEATVEAINPTTREVSLRGARGPITVVASPDVKNFNKIRVGDKVVISYYEGIAAQMAKGGSKVTEPAMSTFTYPAQGGARAGGGVGASVTTTVTIEDVDESTNTVAFKRSDGSVHIIAVKSPNMQQFIRTLKRGDSVEVTYTESVAVSLVPASG